MKGHWLEVFDELLGFILDIVIFKGCIILDWLVFTNQIKTESWGRRIMIVVDISEEIVSGIMNCCMRGPNHFEVFFSHSLLFVLIINSCKEKCLHSHFAEHWGRWSLMPKRINMPSDFRNIIKCLFKPSQPNSHLINNIFIIWCCLIRYTPSPLINYICPFLTKSFICCLCF